jgi:mono/diheme cytochrome c family protein
VLPDTYDPQTIAAMAFVLLVGLAQLIFVWNIVQTMRGRQRARDEESPLRDERQLVLGFALSIAFVAPLFAVAIDQRETAEPQASRAGASGGGPGQELFVQNCGGCHVLQAAGSAGTTGPSLDALRPDAARVLKAIDAGGTGTGNMPPKLLQGAEAQQVADYVARAAGR